MIKTAILLATALVSGMSLPLAGQQTSGSAEQSTSGTATHTEVDQSGGASGQEAPKTASARLSETAYDYMRPINCELAGKLDSKSAKTGDAIVAKTTQSVRMADGTVIPKGAKLVGHLTDVQAHSSDQADSHVSIAFDRAEWSGGNTLPIHSVIQALTPPMNAFASESANSDSFGGAMGAGSRGMGSARGGGGMLGGTASTAGAAGGNLGANPSNLGANSGGVLRTAGQTTGDVAGSAGPVASLGVSPAASASMGAHATAVPGVMLAGDASGATAGTLSALKRNVHLDSGTQFTLAVSTAVSQ